VIVNLKAVWQSPVSVRPSRLAFGLSGGEANVKYRLSYSPAVMSWYPLWSSLWVQHYRVSPGGFYIGSYACEISALIPSAALVVAATCSSTFWKSSRVA
jgi:hypothetical protein